MWRTCCSVRNLWKLLLFLLTHPNMDSRHFVTHLISVTSDSTALQILNQC